MNKKTASSFETETQNIIDSANTNLSDYIQVLYGVRGLFLSSDQVESDEFAIYTNALDLKNFYPGLHSIRFDKVEDGQFIITYVSEEEEEEEIGTNASLLPIKKKTMEMARDTNDVAISPRIENLSNGQPGFVVSIPIYSSQNLDSIEQRQKNIFGFVNAVVQLDEFFNKSVLAKQTNLAGIHFEASDRSEDGLTASLFTYNSDDSSPDHKKTLFFSELYKETLLQIANQEWTFRFWGDPGYGLSGLEKYSLWIILFLGSFLSLMFSFFIYWLYHTRIQVIIKAEKLSEELHKTEEEKLELLKKEKRGLTKENTELSKTKLAMVNLLEDLEQEKEKISKENAKNQTLLSSIGDGVVATDEKGFIIWMNQAAEKMLQRTSAESSGKKYSEILPLYDENMQLISEEKRKIYQVLSSGKSVRTTVANLTHYYARKDGTKFPTAVSTTPIIFEEKIIGAIAVFRDITHEKTIDQAKSEFVSLASHQLRTPLSTINWYSEMLLSRDAGILNEEQEKFVNEIYRGSKRMVELVNALLNVSRLELGTFMIEPSPSDFEKIADDVLKELEPQITTKQMEIVRNFENDLPPINADPKLIRIIFQNLLSNSVKYTQEKGKIEVSIKKAGSDITITVADNGHGIPKEAQEKIYTKLFRADNAKEIDADGTGLGLYIIKSIIDNSGGKISFQSELNKGTSFQISFPLSGMIKKEGVKQLS